MSSEFPTLAKKDFPSKPRRFLRLLGGVLDPRIYLHMLRVVNYYNYTHVAPRRRVTFGRAVRVSPNVVFSNPERIETGDRVTLGARCYLWAGPSRGRILIGDDSGISPGAMLTAATYRYNDGAPRRDQYMDEADVVIGKDVWVGAGAIVLPGAHIGDGSVIGANAIVRGHIPAMSVAAGVPARVVGTRTLPEHRAAARETPRAVVPSDGAEAESDATLPRPDIAV